MEDAEFISYLVVFSSLWLFYGLKWAILISFTIIVVVYALRNYRIGTFKREGRGKCKNDPCGNRNEDFVACGSNESEFYSGEESSMNSRYMKPMLRDLAFTDLQMNSSNSSPRRRNVLQSPQPLISHVNRHLSFNNMSYFPEQTRSILRIKHQQRSTYHNDNTTGFNNTSLGVYSPRSSCTSQINSSMNHETNVLSSPRQERYSPKCFSVIDPNVQSTSMVKITQASDSNDGPQLFESILQKRLQKTETDPCSRHSVLSALSQKTSRKRAAVEHDGSFPESAVYSVKKRRRDDLDDFLDSVSSHQSEPTKTSLYRSLKRRSIHQNSQRNATQVGYFKDYEVTAYKYENSSRQEREISSGSPNRNTSPPLSQKNPASDSQKDLRKDNNIVLTSDDDVIMPTAKKAKKSKTVTFSKETEQQQISVREQDKRHAPHGSHRNLDSAGGQERNANGELFEKAGNKKCLFFSKNSLDSKHLSPIVKPRKKKLTLRSHLTWKDLQENQREAWKHSEMLLDEVEASVLQQTAPSIVATTTSSSIICTSTSSNTGGNGIPSSGINNTTSTSSQLPITTKEASGQTTGQSVSTTTTSSCVIEPIKNTTADAASTTVPTSTQASISKLSNFSLPHTTKSSTILTSGNELGKDAGMTASVGTNAITISSHTTNNFTTSVKSQTATCLNLAVTSTAEPVMGSVTHPGLNTSQIPQMISSSTDTRVILTGAAQVDHSRNTILPASNQFLPAINQSLQPTNQSLQTTNQSLPATNPSLPAMNPSLQTTSQSLLAANPSLPSTNPSLPSTNPSLPATNPSLQQQQQNTGGGFSFSVPTMSQANGSTPFSFKQPTPATGSTPFSFKQPTPATGSTFTFGSHTPAHGFTFGASVATGQNVPLTSTPMAGSAGGFTFGLSGNTTSAVVAKARPRRRAKK